MEHGVLQRCKCSETPGHDIVAQRQCVVTTRQMTWRVICHVYNTLFTFTISKSLNMHDDWGFLAECVQYLAIARLVCLGQACLCVQPQHV